MNFQSEISTVNTIGQIISNHSYPDAVHDIILFGSALEYPHEATDINIALVHDHPPLHELFHSARRIITENTRHGMLHQFDCYAVATALGSNTFPSYSLGATQFTGDMHTEWPVFQQAFVHTKLCSFVRRSNRQIRFILLTKEEFRIQYTNINDDRSMVWQRAIQTMKQNGRIYATDHDAFTIPVHSKYPV